MLRMIGCSVPAGRCPVAQLGISLLGDAQVRGLQAFPGSVGSTAGSVVEHLGSMVAVYPISDTGPDLLLVLFRFLRQRVLRHALWIIGRSDLVAHALYAWAPITGGISGGSKWRARRDSNAGPSA